MDTGKGLGHDIDVVDCTVTPNLINPAYSHFKTL